MFRSLMKKCVGSNMKSCLIITIKLHRLRVRNSEILKKHFEPKEFTSSSGHCSIFSFNGRAGNNEPSPASRTLIGASSTCNEFVDGVVVESNKVHSPHVVRHRGRLPYKRMISAMEKKKNTAQKSQEKKNKKSLVTQILIKVEDKIR